MVLSVAASGFGPKANTNQNELRENNSGPLFTGGVPCTGDYYLNTNSTHNDSGKGGDVYYSEITGNNVSHFGTVGENDTIDDYCVNLNPGESITLSGMCASNATDCNTFNRTISMWSGPLIAGGVTYDILTSNITTLPTFTNNLTTNETFGFGFAPFNYTTPDMHYSYHIWKTGGNGSGNGTGNNGGNNTSNCGNNSNMTDLMVWTDAGTYTEGDTVSGNFFVNCTVIGESYQLDYEVVEYTSNIEYYAETWNWSALNSWKSFSPTWSALPAGEYCVHSTLVNWTGSAYSFVDFESSCFDVLNSTGGGNNTGGNNSEWIDFSLWNQTNPIPSGECCVEGAIEVGDLTPGLTYHTGLLVYADDGTFMWNHSYLQSRTFTDSDISNGVYLDHDIPLTDSSYFGDCYYAVAQLYQGSQLITDTLYEFSWNGTNCNYHYNNNSGNNNTGCGGNSSLTDLMAWTDASTYIEGATVLANYYINCTTNGSSYLLEATIYDTNGWSSYSYWNWVASNSWASFSQYWMGNLSVGNYCVNATLWDTSSNPANFVDFEMPCFDVTSNSNNTVPSNATLDVDLMYHVFGGSFDTEQWLIVSQMTLGSFYEVDWNLQTCAQNLVDSGVWSFPSSSTTLTDFMVQPGWNCLVLEGELFENGNSVAWDSDMIWCNCSNGLNTSTGGGQTPYPGNNTGNNTGGNTPPTNTAPQVSSVVIAPSSPLESDTLTCSYTYSDAENDPDASTIVWTINGIASIFVGSTLSSGYVAGDFVTCAVLAYDGVDYGNMGTSTVLVGSNGTAGSGSGGGLPALGAVGTLAAIGAGFFAILRREDND